MPRDPSSTSLRGRKLGNNSLIIVPVIVCSCIGSGYNTKRPVIVDTAIRIDLLHAGVHYCYPIRSDLPGRAHLVRECPTEAIRHAIGHPRLNREADTPAKILSTQGSWVIAHCTPARCESGR